MTQQSVTLILLDSHPLLPDSYMNHFDAMVGIFKVFFYIACTHVRQVTQFGGWSNFIIITLNPCILASVFAEVMQVPVGIADHKTK